MTENKRAAIKKILPWAVLAVYSALTFLGALSHEMWLDEAQAWVILRDAPLSEVPRILHIEGHPPLWYAVLYPFVKLGFPAEYAPLISWLFMAAGAAVLLFKVELTQPLKYAVLASSGFLFYNSVMLRVYSLIPLLLFLILWIYPKRREHGLLYGLLIALLANTHAFVCGIVGMLGIFMLVDLFSQWKSSSKRENAGKLAGLAIAGAGVLLLVVPLIGSIGDNGAASTNLSFSPRSIFLAVVNSFNDVFLHTVKPPFGGIAWALILLIFVCLMWAAVILLRHWRRALAVEIGFMVFYCLTCGVLWMTNPNRVSVFLLSFVFSLGLAQHEEPVYRSGRIKEKLSSKILKSLAELSGKADKNAKRIIPWILTAFFAVSVPSGASMLFRDIAGNFSSSRDAAEFIAENLEEDAVLVMLRCGLPELSIYDPGITIYAAGSGELCNYVKWEYMYRPPCSSEEVIADLRQYEHLYIVHYSWQYDTDDDVLFIGEGMTDFDGKNSLVIREYSDELIEEYLYFGV